MLKTSRGQFNQIVFKTFGHKIKL